MHELKPHGSRGRDHKKDDESLDREEREATEKAFGIKSTTADHLKVTPREAAALRRELGVSAGEYELRAVIVNGIQGMHNFQILKVFSAFRASEVSILDSNNAIVHFLTRQDVAAMMLNMSKMIRRVRGKRRADEDGEVMSDDDDDVEEGQILKEKGDDIEVLEGIESNDRGIVESADGKDHVVIDVDVRKIPDGKWRLVVKHVPENRFLIVRYPTIKEFEKIPRHQLDDEEETSVAKKRRNADNDFWTHTNDYHSGLNIFDKEGNELDWDYEHDTRFYDKNEKTNHEESEVKKNDDKFELPKNVKVRGRGAVRCGFLFKKDDSCGKSLACDEEKAKKPRISGDETMKYEKDDVLSRVPAGRLDGRVEFH
ncbi:unnamed protein product [Caenorhabditis bovis]|uniref:Uncharacterized protein n=1 Tax=Caenorhabditis bovis TaxID=2654633 RepID=A0A8S1E9F7_9PELO|nr:unnamed protein product [Caenorhabditis bovis]